MATNSSVKKIITIEVQGNQAKASMDGITMSTKQLNQELKSVQTNMQGTSNATGGATATVLELGRTISDSNYGIRGMANNLSQLVSNLVFTTRAAGGLTAGFKEIWSAMMGPLGLILAFQGVIALLERFSMEQDKAKDKTSETTDEIDRQITSLEKLTALTKPITENLRAIEGLNTGVLSLNEAVEILNKKYKDFRGGFQKLSEEQKKDPATVMKLIKVYEKFIKTREELEKKTEKAIELQRQIEESGGEFIEKGGLRQRNPLAMQLDGLNLSIQRLLKEENRLSNFFTFVKTGGSSGGNNGDVKPPKLDSVFDLDSLIEGYDETKQMEFDLRRRHLDSRALFYDEARIQASESNNRILEDEIAHREKMLVHRNMSDMERIEAENEIAMMRMDLQDQEFEHEMLLLDLKMQAQMEYVGFVTGIGDVLAGLGKRSKELATLSLVVQKGAAIAEVVIAASQSIAARMAAHALIPPFITMPMGISIPNPVKAIDAAAMGKDITMTKVGAGISIAAILATAIKGGKRSITSGGGRAGGAEGTGGGRTFDFNLVGTTGTNQLAEAVGAQFQEPIQAFVVSSQITSQQELDLEISTGASLGD